MLFSGRGGVLVFCQYLAVPVFIYSVRGEAGGNWYLPGTTDSIPGTTYGIGGVGGIWCLSGTRYARWQTGYVRC